MHKFTIDDLPKVFKNVFKKPDQNTQQNLHNLTTALGSTLYRILNSPYHIGEQNYGMKY